MNLNFIQFFEVIDLIGILHVFFMALHRNIICLACLTQSTLADESTRKFQVGQQDQDSWKAMQE